VDSTLPDGTKILLRISLKDASNVILRVGKIEKNQLLTTQRVFVDIPTWNDMVVKYRLPHYLAINAVDNKIHTEIKSIDTDDSKWTAVIHFTNGTRYLVGSRERRRTPEELHDLVMAEFDLFKKFKGAEKFKEAFPDIFENDILISSIKKLKPISDENMSSSNIGGGITFGSAVGVTSGNIRVFNIGRLLAKFSEDEIWKAAKHAYLKKVDRSNYVKIDGKKMTVASSTTQWYD
jgi:hypothetical protein